MKNKKAQFWIDSTTLPKWILYPLLFGVIIVLFVGAGVMIMFTISFIKGDASFIPFGWGGWYYPVGGIGFSKTIQECFVNDVEINCSDFSGDEHFCENGICRMYIREAKG